MFYEGCFIAVAALLLLLLLLLLHLLLLLLLRFCCCGCSCCCCCFFISLLTEYIMVRNNEFLENLMGYEILKIPRFWGFIQYETPKFAGFSIPHNASNIKQPKIPRISGFRTKGLRLIQKRPAANIPTISKSRDFRGLVPAAVARKSETGSNAQRLTEERNYTPNNMAEINGLNNYKLSFFQMIYGAISYSWLLSK